MRPGRWFLFAGTRLPSLVLLATLFALLFVGTLFVHSADVGRGAFPGPLVERHIARVAVGLVICFLLMGIHYRWLEHAAVPLYIFGLLLLVALLVTQQIRPDVTRWLPLPGFRLQPSEPMKLFTVLCLAGVLKPRHDARSGGPAVLPLVITAVPFFLIALEPDLGTALVLVPVWFAMTWTRGVSKRRLCGYVLAAVALVALCYPLLAEYQKRRVRVFFHPVISAVVGDRAVAPDARAEGYQIRQSLIAIGSGGPLGRGFGRGPQNTLEVLPEEHNDFIFGVIGEEWGLVGTLAITGLFFVLYVACFGIAYRTRDPFGRLVAVGVTSWLVFQTLVNLGMTVGMAPVTGLPLPFVSFGGSSLLACLAAIGIVLGIALRPVTVMTPDGLSGDRTTVRLDPAARFR